MKQNPHVAEARHPIEDDLKAFCDGELPWLRRTRVRRHLAACAACREEVHAMLRLHERLQQGSVPETALAPALRERILAQVADVPPLPAPRRAPRLVQYGLAASLVVNGLFLFLIHRTASDLSDSRVSSHAVSSPSKAPVPRKAPPPPDRPPGEPKMRGASNPPAMVTPRTRQPVFVPAPEKVARDVPLLSEGVPGRPVPEKHAVTPPLAAPAARMEDQAATPQAPPRGTPKPEKTMLRAAKRTGDAMGGSVPVPDLPVTGADAPAPSPAPAPPADQVPPAPAPALPGTSKGSLSVPTLGAEATRAFASPAAQGIESGRDKPVAVDAWPLLSPRITRTVDADWQVDAQGQASDIRFTPTGSLTVDQAIRDAVRRNHYLPAMKNGAPISARMSHMFVIIP